MKKICVFTSGGDSPGMNSALRAVVRTAVYHGLEVCGAIRGYEGMIEDDFVELGARSVGHIIQRGGTILKSARSERFMTKEGRVIAAVNLKKRGVDGLVVIGGNGSYTGAMVFEQEHGIPAIGLPGTIDNDIYGTDNTIGFDTAVNTALEAIDRIRDTADSHDRLFLIEVMGRHSGYIAMYSGIAGGAEVIMVPESTSDTNYLIKMLRTGNRKGKASFIVVVAEGDESGGAYEIAKQVAAELNGYQSRITILGHIQRGGKPSAFDRILGSRLGHAAVVALLDGKSNQAVGIVSKEIQFTSFADAISKHKMYDPFFLELAQILST